MNQGVQIVIRPAKHDEQNAIRALVEEIATEIFAADLIPHNRFSEEDWSPSWIALVDDKMAGIVLTHEEWISDLWVLADYRSLGVGQALLLQGEAEIAARGHQIFCLRVVKSNTRAIDFYHNRGWEVVREFPHETLPTVMLEMNKHAAAQG